MFQIYFAQTMSKLIEEKETTPKREKKGNQELPRTTSKGKKTQNEGMGKGVRWPICRRNFLLGKGERRSSRGKKKRQIENVLESLPCRRKGKTNGPALPRVVAAEKGNKKRKLTPYSSALSCICARKEEENQEGKKIGAHLPA